jgi:hypothetical protein
MSAAAFLRRRECRSGRPGVSWGRPSSPFRSRLRFPLRQAPCRLLYPVRPVASASRPRARSASTPPDARPRCRRSPRSAVSQRRDIDRSVRCTVSVILRFGGHLTASATASGAASSAMPKGAMMTVSPPGTSVPSGVTARRLMIRGSAEGSSVRMAAKSPAPLLCASAMPSPSRISVTVDPAGACPAITVAPSGATRIWSKSGAAKSGAASGSASGAASGAPSATASSVAAASSAVSVPGVACGGLGVRSGPRFGRVATGSEERNHGDHESADARASPPIVLPLMAVPPPAPDVIDDLPGSSPRTGVRRPLKPSPGLG